MGAATLRWDGRSWCAALSGGVKVIHEMPFFGCVWVGYVRAGPCSFAKHSEDAAPGPTLSCPNSCPKSAGAGVGVGGWRGAPLA